MDKSAIELIQNTAVAASSVEALAGMDVVALPAGMSLESLEEFRPLRNRYRGTFDTGSLDDFAEYMRDHGPGQCFVNAAFMSARAFLNLGTDKEPGHGDHIAVLSLEATAPYKAAQAVNGVKMSQQQIAEWLEDWNAFLSASDADGNNIEMRRAITAVRRITIEASRKEEHTTENMRASRSAMEDIEAKSKDGLPAEFHVRCEPYLGLGEMVLRLRLSVLAGGDKPALIMRIVQYEALQEEMAERFNVRLTAKLGDTAKTLVGTFNP